LRKLTRSYQNRQKVSHLGGDCLYSLQPAIFQLGAISMLVLYLAFELLITMASTTTAAPLEPRSAGGTYCSLGSSFASGYGILPYTNEAAQRSTDNYAAVFAARHPELKHEDLSVAGSTIADIYEKSRNAGGIEFPKRINWIPADTKLVTITIGGNDLNYIGNLGSDGNAPPVDGDRAIIDHYKAGIAAIKTKAPGAKVVLLDYVTIIGTHAINAATAGATIPGLPLSLERMKYHAEVACRLSAITAAAAAEAGAGFIAVGEQSMEHGVGAPTEPWSNGKDGPRKGSAGDARDEDGASYHPNRRGMRAIADMLDAWYMTGNQV
jgi:lysophospholipase L1-like esterase